MLAGRLVAEGAEVRAWDPVADGAALPRGVEIVPTVADAVRGADAAVIVTEWKELKGLASPGDACGDGEPVDRRRSESPRSEDGARGGVHLRGNRAGQRHERERLSHGGDHPLRRQGRAPRRCGGWAAEIARGCRRQAACRLPGRPAREGRRRPRDRLVRSRARRGVRRRARGPRPGRSSPPRSRSASGAAAGSGSPRSCDRRPAMCSR